MFRMKKPAGNGADTAAEVVPSGTVVTAPPPELEEPKAPPKRTTPPVIRSLPPTSPLDLTRRPGEVIGAIGRSDAAPAVARDRTLVVGKDVEFSGEIKACQKLVVEGFVQVNSSDCRSLHIGQSGVFRGRIEVAEAEILGRFDGELVVRERLVIRATGHATGKIRYGTIVIDAGGQISGEIGSIEKRANGNGAADGSTDMLTIPGATVGGGSPVVAS